MSSTQKHYLKINPYLDIISGISVVLSFSDGIIKIIGREGSGKSVLTQLLATELVEEEQEVVIFSDIPHSETELHNPIQQQLHLSLGENSDFYSALNNHIQARPFDQQKLILVFDDADQIPEDCFEAIRVLFEKNYHDRPEVSMVFAGTELLDQKLNEPKNRTFNKNIILNFEVKPMNRSELEAFCNAYLEEMGLQHKHHLSSEDLDDVYAETNGLPGKIPELIFAIFDREEEKKFAEENPVEEKNIISKLVELDDDPEPDMTGLSVEDREIVLTAFKDQVPWRWQSNGVGMAVVILFVVVAYGIFVPVENRTNPVVIFPPPLQSPGQPSQQELATLEEALQQEELAALNTGGQIVETETQEAETPVIVTDETAATDSELIALEEQEVQEDPVEAPPESEETELVVDSLEELLATVAPDANEEPEESVTEEPEETETPELVAATIVEATQQEPEPEQVPDSEPIPQSTIDEQEPQQVAEVDIPAQEEPAASPEPAANTEPTVADGESTPDTDPAIFVTNWLAAWESKNLETYFQSYHSAFDPAGQLSRESWQSDRTAKINRPANIDITVDDLEVISTDITETIVQVAFTYVSPTYADKTVKTLVLASESGAWAILEENNVSIELLAITSTGSSVESTQVATSPIDTQQGESGFEARIRQVLELVQSPGPDQANSQVGMFINDWLGAWKSQDVERYFRHYDDAFEPAYFDSRSDWRADRIRKINEKRFIDIAFDDIEVLDENENGTRIRFWLSYVSSFYLDRTLKEVVISSGRGNNDLGILQERNLEVEIIPFYP